MKYFIKLILIFVLFNSCKNENKIENNNFDFDNFHQIKTTKQIVRSIDGIVCKAKTEIEIQFYEPLKGKQIANQVKLFKNNKIDSLQSHFYNLKFNKINTNRYSGNFQIMYNKAKIIEIEFKAIISSSNKMEALSFKSKKTNKIRFDFTNNNYDSPIKGILCIKIQSDDIIKGKKIRGYCNRYMLVDNNSITDNSYIKKYKRYF